MKAQLWMIAILLYGPSVTAQTPQEPATSQETATQRPPTAISPTAPTQTPIEARPPSISSAGAMANASNPTQESSGGQAGPDTVQRGEQASPTAGTARSMPACGFWSGAWSNWKKITHSGLTLRCKTALCFGGDGDTAIGVEPILELPIGKAFLWHSTGAENLVRQSVETDSLNVSLAAGARLWVFQDLVSFGMIFVNLSLKDEFSTGTKNLSSSSMRSQFPGAILGLFADTIVVMAYPYVLRNDSSPTTIDDRNLKAYEEISRGWLGMVAVAPFTTIKNIVGKDKP